jgi:hypothetical protein
LRRNVAVAMGNSGMPGFNARLEEWAESPVETSGHQALRAAARWALERLETVRTKGRK